MKANAMFARSASFAIVMLALLAPAAAKAVTVSFAGSATGQTEIEFLASGTTITATALEPQDSNVPDLLGQTAGGLGVNGTAINSADFADGDFEAVVLDFSSIVTLESLTFAGVGSGDAVALTADLLSIDLGATGIIDLTPGQSGSERTVDLSTLAISGTVFQVIAASSGSFTLLAANFTAIPLPATLLMLLAGLASLFGVRKYAF